MCSFLYVWCVCVCDYVGFKVLVGKGRVWGTLWGTWSQVAASPTPASPALPRTTSPASMLLSRLVSQVTSTRLLILLCTLPRAWRLSWVPGTWTEEQRGPARGLTGRKLQALPQRQALLFLLPDVHKPSNWDFPVAVASAPS